MILLLLLVEVMMLCLFYLIYRQLLIQLIMIIFFVFLRNIEEFVEMPKTYFSNRTQCVQIDYVLSDFANIIRGVPQGSVLGPLTLWGQGAYDAARVRIATQMSGADSHHTIKKSNRIRRSFAILVLVLLCYK